LNCGYQDHQKELPDQQKVDFVKIFFENNTLKRKC
jgi:hypothetical protein